MSWQSDGVHAIKKRAIILLSFEIFCAFLLFVRMFYLQIIQADRYQILAEKNRISIKPIAPTRGLIFDRNGKPVAYNFKAFRANIIAEKTDGNLEKTLDKFGQLIPLSDKEKKRILKEVSQKKSFMPVRVKDNLSFDEMAKVELNIPDLAGISIDESLIRIYPFSQTMVHPLGYTSFAGENDLKENTDLSKMPDVRIGKTGFEQFYNTQLYGKTGSQKVEINSVGREVRQLDILQPVSGENIYLTLDSRMQEAGFDALKNESGSAVLIDIHTGEVLMMVSSPAFDPNIFSTSVDENDLKKLENPERRPFLNKAIREHYSPGSIFKMVVALAGLEAGVIRENTKINCAGKLFVGTHPFHCWHKEGHGDMNLKDALKHSCDIYFYEIARQVGVDKIVEVANRLGLGRKTGIDLYSEQTGLLPTRSWKQQTYQDAWRLGDTMNMGIGQGFLLVTPLQMAVMTAMIANGGYSIQPHLFLSEDKKTKSTERLFSTNHLNVVKKGMSAVVNEKGGTAYHARIRVNGKKMAGKTASTQVRRISLSEREEGVKKQYELEWKYRDHAFFVAYAPQDNPKYALAVAVEHGGSGGGLAAPIAAQIMKKALELLKEDSNKGTSK